MRIKSIKKILTIILMSFALCTLNVEAKKIIYPSYKVGDVVHIEANGSSEAGEERLQNFIVLEDSTYTDDTIKIIRQWSVPLYYMNGTDLPADTILKDYTNNVLKLSRDKLISVNSIGLDDLKKIGCDVSETSVNCNNAPSWFKECIDWWPSIKINNEYYVFKAGSDCNYTAVKPASSTNRWPIRPVLVIIKEAITGAQITEVNEERSFNQIGYKCNYDTKETGKFECYINIDKEVQKMNFNLKIEGLRQLDSYNVTNESWNETLVVTDSNGIYEQNGLSFTKNSNSTESDELFKITGKVKDLKEDRTLKITLTDLKAYDEIGDYQNISEVTQEIKISKIDKIQSLIENPNTGIMSITLILISLIIICGVIYFIIVKKQKENKDKMKEEN